MKPDFLSYVAPANNGAPSHTQGMFDWVDILESKLDSMSPVGTDLETVKQQIVELKVGRVVWKYSSRKQDDSLSHRSSSYLFVKTL